MVAGHFNQSFEGTNRLPFIPSARLQTELRGDFKRAGKDLKNLYFKIEMDNVAKQNRVFTAYDTETPTDGYTLFNLGTGAEIMSKGKTIFGINISLNNIADVGLSKPSEPFKVHRH